MMMTRSFHLWGILVLSTTLLSLGLDDDVCNQNICTSDCHKKYINETPCNQLQCYSGNNSCFMKCKTTGCKQNCNNAVQLCEMDLECSEGDCEQTCNAKTCKLNCSGGKCKKQECSEEVKICEMGQDCKEGDCEQICGAENCSLTCSGGKCKLQECQDEGELCAMDLECSEGDCEQTCNAKTCKLNCSGGKCKKQECSDKVKICEMGLDCKEGYCEQTCDAEKCNLTCSGGKCKLQECHDEGELCAMDLECSEGDCEQTCDAKTCKLNCIGGKCRKQECSDEVEICEMGLECKEGDCEQICRAEKCNLTCIGGKCKLQKCHDERESCAMDLECGEGDCKQTCDAKTCQLNCSGGKCKKQECSDEVEICEMDLECGEGDCKQTCDAKACQLNCSGRKCKQHCSNGVQVCSMHCNATDCTQTCDSPTCHMARSWPSNSQDGVICSGNGGCCGSLIPNYDSLPFTEGVYHTLCDMGKQCSCFKCLNGSCSTPDLYRSIIITPAFSTTDRVFSTQIPMLQRTGNSHTFSLLQLSSASLLPLLFPSPLSSSSALSLSVEASETAKSESTLSSESAQSSELVSTKPSVSLSSPSLLIAAAVSSLGVEASETAELKFNPSLESVSKRLSVSLSSTSSSPAAASLFPSPSSSPPSSTWNIPSLTLEALRDLANDSISKLTEIDIKRNNSLKEAVRVFQHFTDNLLNITKPHAGQLSNKEDETKIGSIFEVAVAFEEFALNYGKYHLSGTNPSAKITSQNMVVAIKKGYRHGTDFFLKEEEWQASINISAKDFAENGSVVVGCVYKDLHELLLRNKSIRKETDGPRYVNTKIVTAAMNPKPEQLRQDVILRFKNLEVVDKIKHCVFWSGFKISPDGFSEKGCYVDPSNSNSEETVCSCNHLTHFAVLVDFSGGTKLSTKDITILEIITYVGLSLSIIGMLWTITLYFFLTDVRQPLSQIRLSLAVTLGAGQIIFLTGINATENKGVCVTVAALMQYFLMAAFCWMLVEGIYLYLFVVKVYNINTKMHMYHVMSWGLPLVTVAISLCIAAGKEGIQSYTSDKFCWMSSENNLIWIFVTFVITIEVINLVILVRVIKEMSSMQPTGDKQSQQIRIGIRVCVVMIPLLGVTWLFGLLSPLHIAFSYIFNILNSTQGLLIFVLHCLRNSQIRERFKRKVNTIFPSTNSGNSTKKSSQINPGDVGDMWVAELQSCNDFELSEKPST